MNPVLLAMVFQQLIGLHNCMIGLLHTMANMEKQMVSIQRCFKMFQLPQEEIDQSRVKDPEWPNNGEITLKEVQLKYRPKSETVLKGLSFEIKGGQKVGIVGRTGAGKSTLSLSLTRIVEICKGYILIDGHNIADISLSQLRQCVTIIPQDPTLFTGSLRFNIDPELKASDIEISTLLFKAGLNHLADRDLLSLEITENGDNLSSGEKSLICICRAILRKNKVVILDEATANIDLVTEEKI
jgi:ATP-binding cassette subfamily C (CFTR/MRP) protein 1